MVRESPEAADGQAVMLPAPRGFPSRAAKPLATMIHVGTCGYSYADWKGPFYPAGIQPAKMLEFYARTFTAVEIDSTYYRIPQRTAFVTMAARVPAGFRFCVKLPATATHVPAAGAGHVHDDVHRLRENIEPLIAAGKFSVALMQFPNAFHPTSAAYERISLLRDALADIPIAAEFRHRAWQTPQTLTFLRERGIGWVNVDMPQHDSLMRPSADVTSSVGYVRFHGRNGTNWWTGDNVTRYDYNYSETELEPWIERLFHMATNADVREVLSFFNNHRRGQAARNAQMFEAMLRSRFPAAFPSVRAAPRVNEQLTLDGLS